MAIVLLVCRSRRIQVLYLLGYGPTEELPQMN
jgi:hypothetical protein